MSRLIELQNDMLNGNQKLEKLREFLRNKGVVRVNHHIPREAGDRNTLEIEDGQTPTREEILAQEGVVGIEERISIAH